MVGLTESIFNHPMCRACEQTTWTLELRTISGEGELEENTLLSLLLRDFKYCEALQLYVITEFGCFDQRRPLFNTLI